MGKRKYAYMNTWDGQRKRMPATWMERDNEAMNNASFYLWQSRLYELAISMFEWSGLPEGIDQRMLEWWLLRDGYVAFFYDEDLKYRSDNSAPEGYAVLQCMKGGPLDLYNYPQDRTVYAANGFNKAVNPDNSVLIFNNMLRVPMMPTLDMYARRLAEIDRAIDVNVMSQKSTKILKVTDRNKLAVENLVMETQGNRYAVLVDKSIDLSDSDLLDFTSPFVAGDLYDLKARYLNEATTYIGVENSALEKKERLLESEVMAHLGLVESSRFTRLEPRKEAAEKINELFGLGVDVEFRSGIYVSSNYSPNEPTGGMISGSLPSDEGATGY